ncbi:response regulator [Spirulina subsalsa]|nr:response regulator [Spirulina subsalsa]
MMLKIMVVDDEEDIKILFRQKFRKEIKKGEVEFEFVHSAQDAIEYLKREGADPVLILSDINMPGMTGIELLKVIKGNFPELKVFMVTAYGDDKNYQLAQQYGADDYLNKPIDFTALKEKIISLSS